MPAWITYALLALIPFVPVVLAFVGDEPPDNAITHESGDAREAEDDDPDGALMAA